MQLPDYYQTLGVARGETPENIKKAYRKLARRYHPDISKEKNAEGRMKEVNEAYDILSDVQKRAEYDAALDAAARRFSGGGHFAEHAGSRDFRSHGGAETFQHADGFDHIGDLFDQIFGRPGAEFPFDDGRVEATHAIIELNLEDAFTGTEREIAIRLPYRDAAGRSRSRQKRLKVNIPAGVYEGSTIRLAGQGAQTGGKGPGDLLLEVRLLPHPKMRAVKRDVHMKLALAPWEAALGAIVDVSLPTGSVKVRIPKGVQHGRHLTVPGRGLPGKPAGALILEAQIVLPPADTASVERAYEAFARQTAFHPRR